MLPWRPGEIRQRRQEGRPGQHTTLASNIFTAHCVLHLAGVLEDRHGDVQQHLVAICVLFLGTCRSACIALGDIAEVQDHFAVWSSGSNTLSSASSCAWQQLHVVSWPRASVDCFVCLQLWLRKTRYQRHDRTSDLTKA